MCLVQRWWVSASRPSTTSLSTEYLLILQVGCSCGILEDNGFLVALCLIFLKSLALHLVLFFSTHFPVDDLQQNLNGSLIAAQYLQ